MFFLAKPVVCFGGVEKAVTQSVPLLDTRLFYHKRAMLSSRFSRAQMCRA